jgi:hypothetical protein
MPLVSPAPPRRRHRQAVTARVALGVAIGLPVIAGADEVVVGPEPDPAGVAGLEATDSAAADESPTTDGHERRNSPLRVTLAQEAAYKVEKPEYVVKNRSSLRVEYSKYLLDSFFLQLDGRATEFWVGDHRHAAEGHDLTVSQAYVQTSHGQTSIRVGYQTLPWGESILAPITDEVSPRDNREAFNFNLEELRLGQPMLAVDQFSKWGQWSAFYIPRASFNKNPQRGTAYFFDPFQYHEAIAGTKDQSEYGASWRKTFTSGDVTLMGASLIDHDYALQMEPDGLVTRERQRFSLAGAVFNYAMKEVIIRGEVAWKSPQPFNDAAVQIVRRDEIDAYLAVEYQPDTSLRLSIEGINQHVVNWTDEIKSAPRDSRSLLLSVTQLLMHDDLSINVMDFYTAPRKSNLTILQTTYRWNDNVRLAFNVVYPYSRDNESSLWNLRDQKQIVFRVQYQF